MGCSGAKAGPAQEPVEVVLVETVATPSLLLGSGKAKGQAKGMAAKVEGKGKGRGKGKSTGKGKGKSAPQRTAKEVGQIMQERFQILLSGKWSDYDAEEDAILKRAFLVGQPNCKFHLRGQDYEYDFARRTQKNLKTGKQREIRPPSKMTAPTRPLLPTGPMVVCKIPDPVPQSMEIADPNNPGKKLLVAVPPKATPGMRLAVPVPDKGENVQEVVKRQQQWSKGSKMAAGAAAVGALAVGGVVLGEHLSGGAISAWGEEVVADVGDFIADTGAADWVADAAADVGDWVGGAADDAGEWAASAVEDVGDWGAGAIDDIGDFAADAADWFADAAGDAGDFIVSIF